VIYAAPQRRQETEHVRRYTPSQELDAFLAHVYAERHANLA
jgi:hypothetical protein